MYLSKKYLSRFCGFVPKGYTGWGNYSITLLRPEWYIPNKNLSFKGEDVDINTVKTPKAYINMVLFLEGHFAREV